MPKSKSGEIAHRACIEHPDVATKTLARMLWQSEPQGTWPTFEACRTAVRLYRGQRGDEKRAQCKSREAFTANGDERRAQPTIHTVPSARILLFDIETAPHMAYVWKCFKEYIAPERLIQHTTVICWAAKWLDGKCVMFDDVPHDDYTNDRAICESLWALVDEADIVVAHNGRGFDHPLMRTRWLEHEMPPPSPYQTVDTCKLAQTQFRFPRSKLESIAQYLDIGHKTDHDGFKLWAVGRRR